jgi:hypothetical protein
MHNIRRRISEFFDRGEELQVTYIDTSNCKVQVFDDLRINKTLRSHLGFTGKLVEVWRKPNGDETLVLETPNGRTYWANVDIEVLSEEQVALIGREKCVYCGKEVADMEQWAYATDYAQAVLEVGIIALSGALLCEKCADDIEAK